MIYLNFELDFENLNCLVRFGRAKRVGGGFGRMEDDFLFLSFLVMFRLCGLGGYLSPLLPCIHRASNE